MIRILFICYGNICRSPMAEFMFKDMVAKRGLENEFEIASAGTSDEEVINGKGNPVHPGTAAKLAEKGISCGGKRAVQLTRGDYDKYDYLICMDEMNIRHAKRIFGADKEHKLSLLLDFTDRRGQSIADPWFTRNFDVTYSDIDEGLRGFLSFLALCTDNM